MTKNKAIIKFAVILLVLGLGVFLTFANFRIPFTTTRYVGFMGAIENKMGIDLRGGVLAVFDAPTDSSDDAMNATVRRLENMLNSRGFVEASVMRQGPNAIRVEVPGMQDTEDLMQVIGEPADIEFRRSQGEESFITGEHINSVSVVQQPTFDFAIRLHFTNEGGRLFREAIQAEGMGGSIRIFSNGDLISQPTIQSTDVGIDNTALITSDGQTQAQAENFRTQIESGLFEVRLTNTETSIIPATLGAGALRGGIIAFIIAIVFIFLFMWFLYRDMGLVSNLSMFIYVVLFLAGLALIDMVQLTLPGVAGIILALAMAVDANIIIMERIKDEYKSGKRMAVSVESGFKKSFWTIFDANLTSIIASGALFIVGTGPIQGFAVTLLLGVAVSMFCSLFVFRKLAQLYLFINPTSAKRLRLGAQNDINEDIPVITKKERKLNV
ncbi:MAG: SecD/SecF family protein translocase subunit [Firmicutes bacterium]|nr:SecD/SecF family protein translocase subunit [Bacillota bacterium]